MEMEIALIASGVVPELVSVRGCGTPSWVSARLEGESVTGPAEPAVLLPESATARLGLADVLPTTK